ncbi:MAG TPA: sigma 54 modulation/S30EA ribosomal C-terminal domain-containing protein [Acidimicrobiales bacterium]|nr:sigma 54 modulation/S30EA ribosomal C-terminal domain-containing protein [Acidimicrobiales bacterium]
MPDGVMRWFDEEAGEGLVVRAGQRFRAWAGDTEPDARQPGARVHFDAKEVDGVARAVNVSLRHGTRVSRRQDDFATLAGARRAEAKGPEPFAGVHPELLPAYLAHPIELVRRWADDLARGDVDAALALYAPDARISVGDVKVAGRRNLQSLLEGHPVRGSRRRARVRGVDGEFEAVWEPAEPGERGVAVRCRVERGLLSEQRFTDIHPVGRAGAPAAAPFPIEVVVRGAVAREAVAYARSRLADIASLKGRRVLFARIRLSELADPARSRPSVCEVEIDLDGDLLRAHVAARSMHEAVDLVQRRVRDKAEHLEQRRLARRRETGAAAPGRWRHGDLPTARPEHYERPVEERQLVRHKTLATEELTLDEAAFDMEQLDFDFYLFRDLETGLDSVLERLDGGGFVLHQLGEPAGEPPAATVPVVRSPAPVPTLSVDEAIERLNLGKERFVFFRHPRTGRGAVVYLRYDGHYGLITCEESP